MIPSSERRPDAGTEAVVNSSRPGLRPSRRRAWIAGIGIVLVAAGLVAAGREAAGALPAATALVQEAGAWAPLAFIILYAIACIAFVPASLLTLAAGAIFGLWIGIGLVVVGATLGAVCSFLIARHIARARVERWVGGDPRLGAIDDAVGDEGRRIMFLLRLSPAFPFTAMNYALGLTRVRFGDFLIAMVGILPGTTLYVYAGAVAGAVATAAAGAPSRGTAYYLVLALGLVATLAVTVLITRLARRALARAGVGAHAPRDA